MMDDGPAEGRWNFRNMSEHEAQHGHDHGEDHELENPGGLDVPLIATVAVAGAMLLLVTVLATTAWVKTRQQKMNERRAYNTVPYEVQVYRQEQSEKLNRWGRNDDGSAQVPIEKAMEVFASQKKR